ncbi:hypothetical protein CHUAL_001581 [Chamberlinius hualienensis]
MASAARSALIQLTVVPKRYNYHHGNNIEHMTRNWLSGARRQFSCFVLFSGGVMVAPSSHNQVNFRWCKRCYDYRGISFTRSVNKPNTKQPDDHSDKPGTGSQSMEGIEVPKDPLSIKTSESADSKRPSNVLTLKEAVIKVAPKRTRAKFDVNQKSTDRNFITALRAMNEYLLKPSDLEALRKIYRRSPYDNKPPMTVFLRKDVETRSMEVWGSEEALQRELKKKAEQEQKRRESIFAVKQVLKEFKNQFKAASEVDKKKESIWHGSGRVVVTAVAINGSNFILKLVAWMYTGSHSLFSEAIHSLADTCNQLILAYGIHKSIQKADEYHPYGYTNMRYVASLISGVGIFFFGTGLSLYHGIQGLLHMEPIGQFYWAFFILGGSLVSEGATLIVAINEIRRGAKAVNMTFADYVLSGQDPSVNVVLLEDVAAVCGVGIAGVCMGLSTYLNSPVFDAAGSCIIGGLLGLVAAFIIKTNMNALAGRSIPTERLANINGELESDVMIRAIHDAKCIDMGSSLARYKAEIDFDGRELTRSYLDSQDLELLLEEMQNLKTIDEVESFMLKHGENVIDLIGAEIDRIEQQLKKRHPEIRHCDLEML